DKPITSSDVMQQEIAKRMDDFISEGLWNNKHAPVNDGPCRGRGNGFNMANTTTDPHEKFSASYGGGGRSKRCVSRWNHRAAYELSKVVDVSHAKVIRLILRVLRDLENGSGVGGAVPVADSHLVEIGI